MARVTVTATRTVEQTKTVEVKVRIADVKAWMKEEYGAFSKDDFTWHDPQVLEEYFQSHEDLIHILGETEGNVDEIPDDWEVQLAEEA